VSFSAGCPSSGSFASLQESIAGIRDRQDHGLTQLDERLARIEAKLDKPPTTAPPRPTRPDGLDPKATFKVEVGAAHTKGAPEAKVTIVEWSDFQCGYCRKVVPTLKEIEKLYGKDVRIAFKHFAIPKHERARAAAIATEAAGRQGKFFEMHDKVFDNAKQLTDENFVAWAREMQLDVAKFQRDLADPALAKKVDDDQKQGAKLGVRGTPTFFVNGRYLSGAQSLETFKALIDEEKAEADALIAKGTRPQDVYAAVIATGKTP
jgi:protein-disulfide isomerase